MVGHISSASKATDVTWNQMSDEQPQQSFVLDSLAGSTFSGVDGATARVGTLTSSAQTVFYVALSRQVLLPSEYTIAGTSITINVNLDNTSTVTVGYLKVV